MTHERIFKDYGRGITREVVQDTDYPGVIEFWKDGREVKVVLLSQLFEKVF